MARLLIEHVNSAGENDQQMRTMEHWVNMTATTMCKTAIHIAATLGDLDNFKLLIENGADIYARDTEGNTALHHAAKSNYERGN